MDNTAKPTGSVNNSTKVDDSELWSTITTTWASETRTWLDCISLMENTALGIADYLWSIKRTPWTETAPWSDAGMGLNNTAKP